MMFTTALNYKVEIGKNLKCSMINAVIRKSIIYKLG